MGKLLQLLHLFLLFAVLSHVIAWVNENRKIEEEILRNYDRRHRPVKKESTAIQVQLFLTINHIENVDQQEGTMLLHGIIWVSWYDEYLKWTPSQHNNTQAISLETWKIWQPTFALYNSANSNSWFVYMNGVPATISYEGRVFAAGTFTFQVTCQFDFSAFPYDVQECPIVLADWIYDLSKVNLSGVKNFRAGTSGSSMSKPAIRLSFDPLSENTKKHVAGWEIIDTWQRQCYWGPNGYCIDQSPIGPLDNYWSLIEFGVRIKRHAPYYGLILVWPTFVTTFMMLLIFWIDNLTLAIFLTALNLLLEAFSGWTLSQQIPPGDGVMPTIGVVHIWVVLLTLLALAFHCVLHLLLAILPPDIKFLPEKLINFTALLDRYKFFRAEGFSFDPQTIMGFTPLIENHVGEDSRAIGGDVLFESDQSPLVPFDAMIIEMDPVLMEEPKPQFSPIKLEELDQTQSTSSTLSNTPQTASKKPFSLNFGIFGGAKDEPKSKSPSISGPFASGSELFGSRELISDEKQQTPQQKSPSSSTSKLLLFEGNGGEAKKADQKSEGISSLAVQESTEKDDAKQCNEEIPTTKDQIPTTKVRKTKTKDRSALEHEFCVLRRLVFAAYTLASIILLSLLIF